MAGMRGVRLGTVYRGVRVRAGRAQQTGERALQTSRTGGEGSWVRVRVGMIRKGGAL
jgi:hypothetical protein